FSATSLTITGGISPDYTAEFGDPAVSIDYYSYEGSALGLCTGATLDTIGVISESNGTYSLRSYYQTDASNVDTANCAVPTMDNWDLEDWTTSDPAPGFVKGTPSEAANYSMTQSTENHTPGGQYCADLTWSTSENADIIPEYKHPVTPGTTYTCGAWFLDNDPAGRARVYIIWHTSAGDDNDFPSGGYTSDSADWQELTYSAEAPADAISVSCAIRLYDVSSNWDGDATVLFDDMSVSP
ncbi:MAG: hypothetical protein ACOC1F_13645, partial [Myxococcota bacterium]